MFISEIKKFMRDRDGVSWTFTMTKSEYNRIASQLANHFKEMRVQRKLGADMPYEYRIQKKVKYWIVLTISKY